MYPDQQPSPYPDTWPHKSPASVHSSVADMWNKARGASETLQKSSFNPALSRQWAANPNSSPSPSHSNLHNVWEILRNKSPSPAPSNLHDVWETLRNKSPSPGPSNLHDVWGTLRNTSPPTAPDQRNVVHNAWHNAQYNIGQRSNQPSGIFNQTGQPTDNNIGLSLPAPPAPSVQNPLTARSLPSGTNQPNPAVFDSWKRAQSAVNQGPSLINNIPQSPISLPTPQTISPPLPPTRSVLGHIQNTPLSPNPPYPLFPPSSRLSSSPGSVPAPASFAALLNQARRQ